MKKKKQTSLKLIHYIHDSQERERHMVLEFYKCRENLLEMPIGRTVHHFNHLICREQQPIFNVFAEKGSHQQFVGRLENSLCESLKFLR